MDIESIARLFEESKFMLFSAYLFAFNLSLIAIEAIYDRVTNATRDWQDSGANFLIFLFTSLLERTAYGAVFLLGLMPIYYWASPVEIPMNAFTWVAALIASDFSYYWMHRIEHKYRLLWAHHSVHHSSQDYNLTIALRLCVFEGLVTWVFLIPMVLIGFNPFQVAVSFILVIQYQTWIHTQHIDKLKWLDGVINTPSSHRVHHGSNKQYWDKNFGSVLMLWDRLFGTYEPEVEPVVFGLDKNINTNNPVKINLVEYLRLFRDVRQKKHLSRKIKVLFGRFS